MARKAVPLVRLHRRHVEALNRLAESRGVTRSDLFRQFIAELLDDPSVFYSDRQENFARDPEQCREAGALGGLAKARNRREREAAPA
jgi:hypothetical protein